MSKHDNTKEKEYHCKVCNRKLSKKGDICSYCYQEIVDYEKKGFEHNVVLNSLTNDALKKLNEKNKFNKYRIVEKEGDRALEISYIYSYWYDNILKKFDITMLFVFSYTYVLYNNLKLGFVKLIPLILSYILIVLLKHIIIKLKKESTKIYFYNDRVVKEKTFLRTNTKKIYYTAINDIKKKKQKLLPYTTLYVEELMRDKLIRNYIEIEDIENAEDIIPYISAITMLTEPKENTESLSDAFKKSVENIKGHNKEKELEKDKTQNLKDNYNENENRNVRNNRKIKSKSIKRNKNNKIR